MATKKTKRTRTNHEVNHMRETTAGPHLFDFMEEVIERLKQLGKSRTSETYTAALKSFRRFRRGCDLILTSSFFHR
jgi:hypothetical protein